MYFRDFLTPRQLESNKLMFDIQHYMEEDPVEAEEVTWSGTDVYVGDKKYEKCIQPPDPTTVLQMSIPELNEIMGIEVKRGPLQRIQKNTFIGYVLQTDRIELIQKGYMKIRLNHAEARHIPCAWSVPGEKRYECEGYCDDEDFGVGRHILQKIQEAGYHSIAVYVVRNTGEKLNAKTD